MRHSFAIFLITLFASTHCSAADIPNISPAGTWRFEKAVDYLGEDVLPHNYDSIQIVDRTLILSLQCAVAFKREDYTFAGTFQMLLKSGVSSDKLNQFIRKNFAFDMATVRDVYVANRSECSKPFTEFLISKDRLIVTHASTLFYSFVRSTPPAQAAGNSSSLGQKLTPLPFNLATYNSGCDVQVRKGAVSNTKRNTGLINSVGRML
jgi:hypothetical protein